jgi:general secretion pathway protein J
MLIAIAIFGIIAGVAYRTLDASLATRIRISAEYQQWREVARGMASIQRDLEALEQRPVRLGGGAIAPALVGVPALVRVGAAGLEQQPAIALTRGGDAAAGGRGTAPRRIAYRVREGALELLTWSGLDHGGRSVPDVTVVATGIADIVFRYRDFAGRWEEAWPPVVPGAPSARPVPPGQTSAVLDVPLPVGVEVTLVLTSGQRVTRVIPVMARAES